MINHPLYKTLAAHAKLLDSQSLNQLFSQDSGRLDRFQVRAAGLHLDYSKQVITPEVMRDLIKLAEHQGLKSAIQNMWSGVHLNNTENRPVLHVALRDSGKDAWQVDGVNIRPLIQAERRKMRELVESVQAGRQVGYSGKSITDVVNIGIGGSDLGPRLVVKALSAYALKRVRCHFVANVDPSEIEGVLSELHPETTLFIVASKSWSTQETLMNAETARAWLLSAMPDPALLHRHFVAISSRPDRVQAFGISPDLIFQMWDWVGGRYSVWSSIGLVIAFSLGMDGFEAFLSGAEAMDQHFKQTDFADNMPVILALLGVWSINFKGAQTQAILPYDQNLDLLPAYLQQLDMESNGKSQHRDGKAVSVHTAPVIWGGVGTNGQHAFHQLLHQGTIEIPVDFIVALEGNSAGKLQHAALYANCLAQSQALMCGKTEAEAYAELSAQGVDPAEAKRLAPHKQVAGNKASQVLTLSKLTPETLGALLALYEHKVFVQSVMWEINAFDQWGVELGKQLGLPILKQLTTFRSEDQAQFDASTQALIQAFHRSNFTWVILDRDGVINEDSDEYIKSVSEWQALPGSLEAIARLKQTGIPVAVATNQSGLARGLFSEQNLADMHAHLQSRLGELGAEVDAIEYCPHDPAASCACRKPQPGLLIALSKKLNRPLSEAIMVGDHWKDIQAAKAAGCQAVLVKTGKGLRTLAEHPEFVAEGGRVYESLAEFVRACL